MIRIATDAAISKSEVTMSDEHEKVWMSQDWMMHTVFVVSILSIVIGGILTWNDSHRSIHGTHVQNAVPGLAEHGASGMPSVEPTPIAVVSGPIMREITRKKYVVSVFGLPLLGFSERSYRDARNHHGNPVNRHGNIG